MSAIDEYVDVDDNYYFIDKNAIKLVDSNYDELDFYKKILYKHYSNCLVTIIHHTDLLITNFKDSLNYLQPIFLEYSYSKDDYRKYRQIIKDLERQFKTFENRFSLSTPLSNEHFSQYSQSVLCISNQIKCYINRLIGLLSHSDNPTINNQVALIFSRSLHLCTHITYYTRHCRLDKNLFIRPHHIIEHFCKNDIISYILGYEYLSNQIKFEDDASELSDIFKSRYFRNEFAVNDYCLNRQKKEQFPKDIKLKINNILHDINCFDLLTETVTAKSIHKKDLEEKYIEITNGIEQYIFEIKNIIISFLINFHLDVTPIFLDYSNSKISFKDYLSSINLVQNFYDHLDYLKSYDDFEVFLEKLIVIMGEMVYSDELFSYLRSYYNTIKSLNQRMNLIQNSAEDFKKIYDEHLFSIGDTSFIDDQESNYYNENDYGYSDYDDYDNGGYGRSKHRKSFKKKRK